MTAIAHSVFTYKSYPTKAEFEHVAQEMIKKWKFLATLGTVSIQYYYCVISFPNICIIINFITSLKTNPLCILAYEE